jgi:hypothetical protein
MPTEPPTPATVRSPKVYSFCHRHAKVARGALWALNSAVATALLIASHLGVASTDQSSTAHVQRGLQNAAVMSVGLLAVCWMLILTLRQTAPRRSHGLLRAGRIYLFIALTGMPWTYLSVLVCTSLGHTDFWGVAQVGGALGFVAWLRALSINPLVLSE